MHECNAAQATNEIGQWLNEEGMGATRPGIPLRGCARRTGFEVLNRTRPKKKGTVTLIQLIEVTVPFFVSGGEASRPQTMLRQPDLAAADTHHCI